MPLRALLRGDAWIERGNALRQQCQLALAQEAFEHAIAIYQQHPLAELDLERARRGRALVLHDTGRSAEALEIIEAGIAVFRRDRDLPDLARSYLYRGAVQFEIDAYSDARSSFIDALSLARELGDRRTEARLLLNLGHCADALGDPQAAIAFLMDAFRDFVDLDMRSDQARVKWALAGLLAGAGELDHAIQHIEHAARTLTNHGLPGDAALATLDLLRMLHQTGRTESLTWTATQLVTFFTGHGLLPHALEALRLLQEAAREGTLAEEDFDEARRRMEGEGAG